MHRTRILPVPEPLPQRLGHGQPQIQAFPLHLAIPRAFDDGLGRIQDRTSGAFGYGGFTFRDVYPKEGGTDGAKDGG